MSLSIRQNFTAILLGRKAVFSVTGGVAPYVFTVLPGGIGGTIDANGVYTAPDVWTKDEDFFDEIEVTDANGDTISTEIVVGTHHHLFCEIIQRQLKLDKDRVYMWNQNISKPHDPGLFVAVSVPYSLPFSNVNTYRPEGDNLKSVQYVNVRDAIDIDAISIDMSAFLRKEDVLLALNSDYSMQQQHAFAFQIAKLPPTAQFKNLSEIDGAKIPYRYKITINMTYAKTLTSNVDFYDELQGFDLITGD